MFDRTDRAVRTLPRRISTPLGMAWLSPSRSTFSVSVSAMKAISGKRSVRAVVSVLPGETMLAPSITRPPPNRLVMHRC